MISFEPLEHTLISKGITKTKLREDIQIGRNTLAKFSKGESVGLDIIDRICIYLHCNIQDVVEIKGE